MEKFGIAAAICTLAAHATGPFGLWGATCTCSISAIEAMRRISEMPPQWQMSGWIMSTSERESSSLKPHLKKSRSPVASSVLNPAFRTRASASRFSGGHGSSKNSRPRSSIASICLMATGARDRPWLSIMMSMSGPSSFRMPLIFSRRAAGMSFSRTRFSSRTQPLVLNAAKPWLTTSFAVARSWACVYARIRSRTGPPSSL